MGSILTNLESDNRAVVRFYHKRGTAERWIKEGKQVPKMTRLRSYWFLRPAMLLVCAGASGLP